MSEDSFGHQDWKPVVFKNPQLVRKKELENGEKVKKSQYSGPVAGQKNIDGEDYIPKKFDKVFGKIVSSTSATVASVVAKVGSGFTSAVLLSSAFIFSCGVFFASMI